MQLCVCHDLCGTARLNGDVFRLSGNVRICRTCNAMYTQTVSNVAYDKLSYFKLIELNRTPSPGAAREALDRSRCEWQSSVRHGGAVRHRARVRAATDTLSAALAHCAPRETLGCLADHCVCVTPVGPPILSADSGMDSSVAAAPTPLA
jgi:hypothetical protein